jgi:RNA polymerase subunit RPABC4/transcription elongation factor Spt4
MRVEVREGGLPMCCARVSKYVEQFCIESSRKSKQKNWATLLVLLESDQRSRILFIIFGVKV